jgi:hypothetical protein
MARGNPTQDGYFSKPRIRIATMKVASGKGSRNTQYVVRNTRHEVLPNYLAPFGRF